MRQPFGVRLSLLLTAACVLLAPFAATVRAVEPSPDEVVRRCIEAMNRPLKYTVDSGASKVVIYQKRLDPQAPLLRIESSGVMPVVVVQNGDRAFELFPEKKIAIELGYSAAEMKAAAMRLTRQIDSEGRMVPTSLVAKTVAGKPCYEVELTYKPELLAEFLKANPTAAERAPTKRLVMIDATTSLPVYARLLTSGGTELAASRFIDFDTEPKLPDELFEAPSDYDLRKPADAEAHRAIYEEILSKPK